MDTEVTRRKESGSIRDRRARVCFSYEPQQEDELALKIGDEVVIHGEDEEGWYQATVKGKKGVCPSNFVELIPDEMSQKTSSSPVSNALVKDPLEKDSSKDPSKETSAAAASPVPPATSASNPDAKQEEKEKEIQPKKIVGGKQLFPGNIFDGGPITLKSTGIKGSDKIIGPADKDHRPVRPASVAFGGGGASLLAKDHEEKENKKDKVLAKEDTNVEYVRAEHDYIAENADELSFKAGDMIRLISRTCEDDGWWRGEINGKQGVFPDNFGTIITAPANGIDPGNPKRPERPRASEKKEESKKDDKENKKEEPKTSTKSDTKSSTPTPVAASPPVRPDKPEKPTSKPSISRKPVAGKEEEKSSVLPEKRPSHEEELALLRNEVSSMKESFTCQLKELKDLLKLQSEKTAALEKELEELRRKK